MFKSLAALGAVLTTSCDSLVKGIKLVDRTLDAGHAMMDVADAKIEEMVTEARLDLRKAQLKAKKAEAEAIALGLIEDLVIEHKPSDKPSSK